MLLIDKILWGCLIFFFLTGWWRGFLKSLIGPVAFLCCFVSAVIFYDLNQNILMAFVIASAGTIALAIALYLLLAWATSFVDKEFRGKVSLISRLLGATINVLWQSAVTFTVVLFLPLFPLNHEKIIQVQNEIPESQLMGFYESHMINKSVELRAAVAAVESVRDPAQLEAIIDTPEFKNFLTHSRVQTFLNDPEVILAIEQKDTAKLLRSKSLKDLVTNDDAMFLLTKICRKVYEHKLETLSKPTPQPAAR